LFEHHQLQKIRKEFGAALGLSEQLTRKLRGVEGFNHGACSQTVGPILAEAGNPAND